MDQRALVLIRVEAGPGIGLGHLARCISIGHALTERGADWQVLTHDPSAAAALVERETLVPIDGEPWSAADADQVAVLASRAHATFTIVDSYDAGARYLDRLRARGGRVAVIQDSRSDVPCDLLINPTADAAPLDPRTSVRVLQGPAFVPLRREFWRQSARHAAACPRRLLITLGGSDSRRLSGHLLGRALEILDSSMVVSCIAGPFFDNLAELRKIAARAEGRAEIIESPSIVGSWLRDADAAIAGGGQTLYELATVGTATVGLEMAANQHGQLTALGSEGVIRVGGSADDPGIVDRCLAMVSDLLGDQQARHLMARRGQTLVDGQGALRVGDALLAVGAAS